MCRQSCTDRSRRNVRNADRAVQNYLSYWICWTELFDGKRRNDRFVIDRQMTKKFEFGI